MNTRLTVNGSTDPVEEFIMRKIEEEGLNHKIRRYGNRVNITIDGDYQVDFDAEIRHPGFVRDNKITSILDFLDEEFDENDDSEDGEE